MRTKSLLTISITVFLTLILFTSCAEAQHVEACTTGHTYGFFGGVWHGIIAPFTFVISLFNDHVAIWAVNNNGHWYSLGFLLGISSLGIGGSKASR